MLILKYFNFMKCNIAPVRITVKKNDNKFFTIKSIFPLKLPTAFLLRNIMNRKLVQNKIIFNSLPGSIFSIESLIIFNLNLNLTQID